MAVSRPSYVRLVPLALVLLGGALGASGRELLLLTVPPLGEVLWLIATINIAGAFLIGFLYEALQRVYGTRPTAQKLRLLLGVGFCGGFTTYSSFAFEIADLLANGQLWLAVSYALGTVVVGAVATWLGLFLATRLAPRSDSARHVQEAAA